MGLFQSKVNQKAIAVLLQDHVDDEHLKTLLVEYGHAIGRLDKFDDRILQIIGVGLTIIGAITGYVVSNRNNITTGIALIAPLPLFIFVGLLLLHYYWLLSQIGICRVLSIRINMLLKEISLLQFDPDLFPGMLFSPRRGDPKFRLLLTIVISIISIACIAILVVSFDIVYQNSHLIGSGFLLFYSLLAIFFVAIIFSIITDVSDVYRFLSDKIKIDQRMPGRGETLLDISTRKIWKSILLFITPRPRDVFLKGIWFWYGFIAAFAITSIHRRHIDVINLFFVGSESSGLVAAPFWSILMLGFIYFFVQEVLLQQAKLLWDDIRDVNRDKVLLQNKGRALATGTMSTKSAVIQMLMRWIAAFFLGYLLGGATIVILYTAISIHQAVYVLWGKPRGKEHPLVLLLILSFNVGLRFIGGIIAVAHSEWLLLPFIFILSLSYLITFGTMAAIWKMEAKHQLENNELVAIRPQSSYYLQNGEYWQHIGFSASVLLGVILIFSQIIAQNCNKLLILRRINYNACAAVAGYPGRIVTSPALSIILLLVLVALPLTICIVIAYKSGNTMNKLKLAIAKSRVIFTPILSCFFIFTLFFAAYTKDSLILVLSFLLLSILHLVMHEGMTYKEFTYVDLKRRLPVITKGIYAFLFTDQLSLRTLIDSIRRA